MHRRGQWRATLGLLLLAGSMFSAGSAVRAQEGATVYLVEIHSQIDLGLAPFLARVLDQAAREQARAVILEIETPGGRLDAALQMRSAILASPVRTIAFINREAFSAGALIALAADEIYMAPGGVIGAATPVDGAGEPGDEKTISAVRSTFRATAETRGRNPLVAEAMVDPAVEIEGVIERGQLLTLTADEARAQGYAEGIVADRTALLAATELVGAAVVEPELSMAEQAVRFLTNPIVASLLISLGFLLLLADLYSGGFGAIGGIGVLLFALFFWGHFLVGLAGWEGVALVALGFVLIAVEIFVIPGFGAAGVLGLIALLGGLFISLVGGELITTPDLVRAGTMVLSIFVLVAAGALLLLVLLPRSARLQGLVLQAQVAGPGPSATPARGARRQSWIEGERLAANTTPRAGRDPEPASLLGAVGVALSDLRPGGFAEIGGERVDVVTRGDYIRAGEPIEVIADETYRRVVRRAHINNDSPV